MEENFDDEYMISNGIDGHSSVGHSSVDIQDSQSYNPTVDKEILINP